jgi:hypothetical protein
MQYNCNKLRHGLKSPEHNMGIMIQKKTRENKDNSDKTARRLDYMGAPVVGSIKKFMHQLSIDPN